MARRGHAEDTWAGVGWFLVILAAGIGAYLLVARRAGPAPDPFSGGLDVELRADLAAARAAGRVDAWEDDATLLRQTADVLRRRVLALGVDPVAVVVDGTDRLHVRLPPPVTALPPEVKAAVTGDGGAGDAGTLALRLVVGPGDWPAEAGDFEAWRTGELLRWQQAAADGGTYVPGRVGYRIARRAGAQGLEAWDFVVLRAAASPTELFFGSAMLEAPEVAPAGKGRWTLAFRIRPALAERFRAFTAAHVGRRLAILVEGEVVATPTIAAPIEGALSITLDRRLARAEAERLARQWVGPGPLRVRCYYVGEARIP